MSEQRNSSDGSFLRAVGGLLRFLLRLIFVLILGTVIGLGLFYGVPWAYRRLAWPVQENSARIAILEEQVSKNSDSIFNNRLSLEDRIADLEEDLVKLQEQGTARAEDQEGLEQGIQQVEERVAALEGDLQTQREEFEKAQADFSGTATSLSQEIDGLGMRLEAAQEELEEQVGTALEDVDTLEDQLDEAAVRLLFLQTAQDLLKVRLLLVEDNPGTARETLALAVDHLDRAGGLVPEQRERVEELRERLVAVDELIASASFRARPSLEALWADLMDFVTPLTAQSTVTVTEEVSPLPTPSP